jgi:hypothetical protein
MNAIIRTALCAAAFAAPIVARAAEPAASNVLLIDYDRLIEGQIERIGNKFRIRQDGGEMSIPATPTMLLFADRAAAFQVIKSRAKLNDPHERVRLARWCLTNELKPQAVQEAEAALALQPDNRALARFVADVKARAELMPPVSAATWQQPQPKAPPVEPVVDVNPESFSVFVTKVQPILMNACGQCHCGDRGGAFKLARTNETYGDKRATQRNLAAASAFLNRDQPAESTILARAVSVHGESAHPPLHDRQSPAYRHLEEWVRLASGRPLMPAPPAPLPVEAIAGAQPLPMKETPAGVAMPTIPIANEKVVPAKATEPAKPAAPPKSDESSDPFDPKQFNKQGEKK